MTRPQFSSHAEEIAAARAALEEELALSASLTARSNHTHRAPYADMDAGCSGDDDGTGSARMLGLVVIAMFVFFGALAVWAVWGPL